MKLLLQAFLGALFIHIIYFVALFAVGYVKTLTYRPNMALYWENAERLPQEVAFGTATSPVLYLATFFGVMLMCGILLFSYKKVSQLPLQAILRSV